MSVCALCDRNHLTLTTHHLIPRQQTKRKKQETGPTIEICSPCHRQIHAQFTNKELAAEFNSIAKLKANKSMQKFLAWIRKQDPARHVRTRKAS